MIKKSLLSVFALLVVYLLTWPVEVDPVAWQAPDNLGYTGEFAQNQQLSQLHRIELNGDLGPEDYAIDSNQNIYFGLLNGDIKFLDSKGEIHTWVNTGGRPLGIEFDGDGNYNWNLKVFTHQGSFDDGFEIPVDLNGDGFTVLNNWSSYTAATINPIITSITGSNANYILSLISSSSSSDVELSVIDILF